MAISRRGANVLIVALLLLLFYALNPSSEDFRAWRSAQARPEAAGDDSSGRVGTLSQGDGVLAAAGLTAGGYERRDYLLCSTYSLGSERYIGGAHLFFRLK